MLLVPGCAVACSSWTGPGGGCRRDEEVIQQQSSLQPHQPRRRADDTYIPGDSRLNAPKMRNTSDNKDADNDQHGDAAGDHHQAVTTVAAVSFVSRAAFVPVALRRRRMVQWRV